MLCSRSSSLWRVDPADSSTTRTVGPWCQFHRLRSERPRPSRWIAARLPPSAAAAMSPARRRTSLDRQPWVKSRKGAGHARSLTAQEPVGQDGIAHSPTAFTSVRPQLPSSHMSSDLAFDFACSICLGLNYSVV